MTARPMRRELGGGIVHPGDDADEAALAALGVLGAELLDPELRMPLHGHLHGGDGLGLVVLDADDALRVGEEPEHDLHALHDPGAVAPHELVVAGDVGLALGAVGDDVLDGQRVLGSQLHMGGEARAAEARDARVGHPLEDLLVGDVGDILLLVKGAGLGVLAVAPAGRRRWCGASPPPSPCPSRTR